MGSVICRAFSSNAVDAIENENAGSTGSVEVVVPKADVDQNHPNWLEDDFKLAAGVEEQVSTPALVVSLPNVRHNIAAMIELCGGEVDRWRPHVKTTKMPLIWRELVRQGVRNFKCATVREARLLAEVVVEQGIGPDCDILVAFPLQGANLRALGNLAEGTVNGPAFSCLVEGPEDIGLVPDGVGYFVDINPGMDRTGRTLSLLESQLPQFATEFAAQDRSRFRGLHFYDGHSSVWESGATRQSNLFPLYANLLEFATAFEAACGVRIDEVITSGTPSCTSALAYSGFASTSLSARGLACTHRVSPGTTVFHDRKTHDENSDLAKVLRPAAAVMVRVVSHPTEGMLHCGGGFFLSTRTNAFCLTTWPRLIHRSRFYNLLALAIDVFTVDAGSKALAAEVPAPIATVLGAESHVALGPSEEHLPIKATAVERPARGSILYLVPKHVSGVCVLFQPCWVIYLSIFSVVKVPLGVMCRFAPQ